MTSDGINRRFPIGRAECQLMLATLVRNKTAFQRAALSLTSDKFVEAWHRHVWTVCVGHYATKEQRPSRTFLAAKMEALLEQDGGVADDVLTDIDDFMNLLYEAGDDQFDEEQAFVWLRTFLEDRLLDAIRVNASLPTSPVDLREQLSEWTDAVAGLDAVSGQEVDIPFPDQWHVDEPQLTLRPTGIAFVDRFTQGGVANGEVCGLLGPYQGGKTTMGVMLSTRAAAQAYAEWVQAGREGPVGFSYHFSYEEPMGSLRIRALMSRAQIRRDRLTRFLKGEIELSTPQNLEDYERRLQADAAARGGIVLGEQQRMRRAINQLNQHWRVKDLVRSGGTGMVEEIASIIASDLAAARRRGIDAYCRLVVIDYVLAAISKYMYANKSREDELRRLIARFPYQAKVNIAAAHQCPVWCLHQLSTSAQAKAPGAVPTITDAAECHSFSENMDFSLALGVGDRDGRAAFAQIKARRVERMQPIVVQIDGALGEVRDCHGDYSLAAGRIVRASESRLIGVPDATADTAVESGSASVDGVRQRQLRNQRRMYLRPQGGG